MKHLAEIFCCLIMLMKAYSLDALMPRFRDKSKCLDDFFFLLKCRLIMLCMDTVYCGHDFIDMGFSFKD